MIAAAQWVLPQVDIYVGELSPFSEALNFTISSSRSNASGKRIHRHSKPNGGPTFRALDKSNGDEDSNSAEQAEVQVRAWGWLTDSTKVDSNAEKWLALNTLLVLFTDVLDNSEGKAVLGRKFGVVGIVR